MFTICRSIDSSAPTRHWMESLDGIQLADGLVWSAGSKTASPTCWEAGLKSTSPLATVNFSLSWVSHLSMWTFPQGSPMSCMVAQAPSTRAPTDRKWRLQVCVGIWHSITYTVFYWSKQSQAHLDSVGGDRGPNSPWENVKDFVAFFNLPYLPFSLRLAFVLH